VKEEEWQAIITSSAYAALTLMLLVGLTSRHISSVTRSSKDATSVCQPYLVVFAIKRGPCKLLLCECKAAADFSQLSALSAPSLGLAPAALRCSQQTTAGS
jgi:hypothetical protein